MQFNGRSYKRNEELRVLGEIKMLKKGKEMLKDFENNKEIHSGLISKLMERKTINEQNKIDYQILLDKQTKLKDDIRQKSDQIDQIQLSN
jgi:hypothetical protein